MFSLLDGSGISTIVNGTVNALISLASPEDHKDLWPLDARDGFVFGAAAVVLFVASVGGIGGGGVLVPLYIIVARFSTSRAVALSNITVLGGALSNVVYNIPRRHPCGNRPLINWDLILVMEPATVLGAVLGGYLNMILPGWLTNLLLACLLTVMTYQLIRKSIKLLSAEYRLLVDGAAAPLLPDGHDDDHFSPDMGISVGEHSRDRQCQDAYPENLEMGRAAEELLAGEAHPMPWKKILVLLFLSAWVVTSESLKGKLPCGSLQYWLVAMSPILCVAVITLGARHYLLAKEKIRRDAGLISMPGDMTWNPHTTLQFPALCSLAGVAAGLAGVGGGIMKAPLMLQLGVLPEVATATSSTMILFTTGATAIVYLNFGILLPDYAILLFTLGVVITFAGQRLMFYVVRLLGRRSLIVVMMSVLMATAMCIAYAEVAAAMLDAWRHKTPLWTPGGICTDR